MNLAVAGETIFRRFAEAIDKKEWIEMDEFKDAKSRLKNRDYLNELIEEVTILKTSEEWVDLLEKVGCPCGPIYTIDQMFNDPQVKHLQMAKPIETHPFGKTELVSQPFKLSRTPSEFKQRPPHKGEHTEEILDELGISSDKLKV